MRVVAIVCAKDEAPRIGEVLRVLCPMVRTIVVDDGSTDGTAGIAKQYGAEVISLPQNIGKGRAMLVGVQAVQNDADVVLFADADLKGFEPWHVLALLRPVMSGEFGMVVGMRDHGDRYQDPLWNHVAARLPLISGERAVRMDVLRAMPEEAWNGFGVEVWMNHVAAACGARIGSVLLSGLSIVLKWEKEGLDRGIAKMADMGAEIIRAHERAALSTAQEPPTPSSFLAQGASSEQIMRALSSSIVDASTPLIHERLWTPEIRHQFAHTIARKVAMPVWTVACAACAFFFGPVAGTIAFFGAFYNIADFSSSFERQKPRVREGE